jgi:hypothetical protein
MQPLHTLDIGQITLNNLRWLLFRGMSAYLVSIVSRISAPSLRNFYVYLQVFHQFPFHWQVAVPHILQSMQSSENFRFNAVELSFEPFHVGVTVGLDADLWGRNRKFNPPLLLRIMCRPLDWQVASAVQILDTLSLILSVVEKVTLCYVEYGRTDSESSERHNDVDRTQWRGLFGHFSNVKPEALHVQVELIGRISRSLSLSLYNRGLRPKNRHWSSLPIFRRLNTLGEAIHGTHWHSPHSLMNDR